MNYSDLLDRELTSWFSYTRVCAYMYKMHNLIFPSFAYNQELELNNDDDTKLVCEDMGISVEDDECTITMVEDGVSVSQISLPTFQPLPVEDEAIIVGNDIQAPQDSCGITNVATPNEEPRILTTGRSHYLT